MNPINTNPQLGTAGRSDALSSSVFRPKDEQVGHRRTTLLVLETMKVLAVYPIAIGIVGPRRQPMSER
jgi:hypothetical protein